VLTRQEGESIVINDNIFIEVLEIDGNRVMLGCIAPRDIPIWRGEVHEVRSSELKGVLPETQNKVSMAADKEPDCNA
jgi:carbon storage regulator